MSRIRLNGWIAVVALLFGGSYVAMKLLLRTVPPEAVVMVRLAAGALAFNIIGFRGWLRRDIPKIDWLRLIGAGFFGAALNQVLFTYGLRWTTAAHSSLINATIPVLTMVVALLIGYERGSLAKFAGLLLALGGTAYLMEIERMGLAGHTLQGDLLTFGNAFSYSIYLVIARPLSSRYSAFWITGVMFATGLVIASPFFAPSLFTTPWQALSPVTWGCLAFVVFGPTLGAYGIVSWLLRHTESSHIAQGVYLQPIIAITLATLFLAEPLAPRLILATIIILGGVALAQLRPSPH